jgi:DNA-binding beta-propeller fold protein YncE
MAQLYPNTPNIGDSVTENSITRVWNGEKWQIVTGAVLSKTVQTTGNIDISAGNWHTITTGELSDLFNVNVSLANIPSGSSKWTVEFQNSTVKVWQIETASYDNASFSVSSQDSVPRGIFFKPDGTKMYMIGDSSNTVYQYSLSTTWDITTASYDNASFSVSSQDTSPYGIFFKPDGTKMYMVGINSDRVHQYSLSTAWDITTASYDAVSFLVIAQDSIPTDIFFKPDGTKMYMVGFSSDTVHQYSLSTAWNIATASYDAVSFSVGSQDGSPTGISFKPDGTKMYMVGNVSDTVHQYSLATAWDIATASYDSVSFSVGSQDGFPTGIFFKPDGTKMYMAGITSDTVHQYTTSTDIVVNWPNNITWQAATVPEIVTNQTLIIEFYTPDGGTTIYGVEKLNRDNSGD